MFDMKYIQISRNIDHTLKNNILAWCENSFGPGGVGMDWLIDNDRLIFWEDSYYMLFSLRWLDL